MKNKVCGSWKSLITSGLVAKSSVKFLDLAKDGDDIYLSMLIPQEKGKVNILKFNTKKNHFEKCLPKNFSARTKVHEFGGLSFCVKNKEIFFSNFQDQQIYKIDSKKQIFSITKSKNSRFVNYIVDDMRNLVYCIEEKHLKKGKVDNSIVKIDNKKNVKRIIEGEDFYSSLVVSEDNKKIAFLSWNHPYMPWDKTNLFVGNLTQEGDVSDIKKVAGFEKEAIFQPRWAKDGSLYFISDRTGFGNLYRLNSKKIENVCPYNAEFGRPLWVFGLSTYDFYYEKDKLFVIASYIKDGKELLVNIDPENKIIEQIKSKYQVFSSINVIKNNLYFIGKSPLDFSAVVKLDLTSKKIKILKKAQGTAIDKKNISIPKHLGFLSKNNKKTFLFYYPPKNKDFKPMKKEKPPLIVRCHGGPTAQAVSSLDLQVQFWTTRGFAFADVNYSGSTGYGREYQKRLYKNWGILDVEDSTNAALFLVKKGLADKDRLLIKGSSAGGYTVLCCLTFKSVFLAGASYYGISDLLALVEKGHKFEANYERQLIGPLPEKKDIYIKRSPIYFINKIKSPIIFFHGKDDKVVLPEQSKMMMQALKKSKIPTAFLLFENEGHGFKNSSTIKKCLDAELYFYLKILKIKIDGRIKPIKIENLT